jgi:hypothetical protein
MIEKDKKSNYYKWSIEQGDYVRDRECTSTFEKKKKKRLIKSKVMKVFGITGLFLFLIAIIIDLLLKS